MLESGGIEFRYRDYLDEPLSAAELRELFGKLQLEPAKLLRPRDEAYARLGLTGREDEAVLIDAFAANPTLLQRPIGVLGAHAAVGRPVENLLKIPGIDR